MADGKFYWLKLKRDFFKRKEIKIVENMPNGKDYILFYLKLLLESVECEGRLRLSDTIPYDENMLATLTDTNVDIVRSAMQIFPKLNMIEILDDQTVYMSEIQNMIGSETKWAEKKRQYREKINQKEDNVPSLSDKSKSIELEKELDIEIDKDISPKVDISLEKEIYKERDVVEKPKKEKFDAFKEISSIEEIKNDPELLQTFKEFVDMRNEIKKPIKSMKGVNGILNELRRLSNGNHRMMIEIIKQSIDHEWCGVFEVKRQQSVSKSTGNPFGEMLKNEGYNAEDVLNGKSGDFNFT